MVFLIAAIGYILGSISFKGIQLGTSVVLIVALVFGHFGVVIDPVVRNFGLTLFIGAVGLIAGPVFFRNFKRKAFSYIIMGALIIVVGAVTTAALCKAMGIPGHLAVGIYNGAMTSTPGLAAAMEISDDAMLSVGYGVAYLFGVVGVVLFIQICPKLMGVDIVAEAKAYSENLLRNEKEEDDSHLKILESSGMLLFTAVMTLGVLLGMVKIPIPGGGSFSLGSTGGPLFMGIIVGHFRRVGNISIRVPKHTLSLLRELGLMLFLIGAGTDAGQGFVEILGEYGWLLFLQGAVITLMPMLIGSVIAIKVMKMDVIGTLGSICGGMTSTPALGTLITSAKTDDVTIAYAATYPIALILIVLSNQLLMYLL